MKKTAYLLIFLLLLVFTQLADAATPRTELPNLIGIWQGKTKQVGSTTIIDVTLTLTNVANSSIPNGKFLGTLTIGADTVEVIAKNGRDYAYKVEIVPVDPLGPLTVHGSLDWLPGPMILVNGMGYNNTPYKSFILKKNTP